jgi:Lipase (class 3)
MAERLEALFWKLHGAIDSRFPNFGIKPPQPPAEKVFERGNAHLLARLALLCAQSYKWTPSTFSSDMILQERTYFYVVFPRRNGALSWWPGALIWMPVSYIALLFSFAFVVSVLLAAAPIGWSMWHEQLLSMTPALEYVWQIIVSSVLWLLWPLSWPLAGLAWVFGALNWLVITFFTMLGGWLPAALVSLIEYSAMVAGVCVAWVLDHLVGFIALVVFRVPPSVQDWLQGHTDSWFPYFLYELRIVFGLALLLGSAIASILLFFPRLASGRAFGFVAPNRESATIIFCGSTFIDNFMINACVWLYPKPIRHRGFHRAWNHIKPDVEQWLATKVPKDAAIFMAGHYLRGAIAEIAAFDLAPEYPIGLVAAFGSSRIGNPKMRKLYKERLDKNGRLIHECTRHITHDDDTIPRLPPTGYFNHVGEGFLLSPVGRLYKGTRPSIFLDYLETIHTTAFYRYFFDGRPLSIKEAEYPALDPIGWKLPIPAFEKFKWYTKIFAFFVRDWFPFYFMVIWFVAFLVFVYAMLPHYARAIRKGLQRDHKVSLYRDALQARARLLFPDLLSPAEKNKVLHELALRGYWLPGYKPPSPFAPPAADRSHD